MRAVAVVIRKRRLVAATLLVFFSVGGMVLSQPLLREREPLEEPSEPNPEQAASARRQAQLEEERRMKLQAELMQLRGEQMLAERQEKERNDRMMRYALWIAIAVIATTFLIAFARSRVAEKNEMPPGKTD